MQQAPWAKSTYWLYTTLVGDGIKGGSRGIMQRLRARGIDARPLWQPLHFSPAHLGSQAYRC
jgi:dTDP-4-amino-4,6-dideoxygalactose transaminase